MLRNGHCATELRDPVRGIQFSQSMWFEGISAESLGRLLREIQAAEVTSWAEISLAIARTCAALTRYRSSGNRCKGAEMPIDPMTMPLSARMGAATQRMPS